MTKTLMLDVLVDVDAENGAEKREEVEFDRKSYRKLEENQIKRDGWLDARSNGGREDILNCPLGCHYPEDFPQNPSHEPTEQYK